MKMSTTLTLQYHLEVCQPINEIVQTNFNFARFLLSKFTIRIIGKRFRPLESFIGIFAEVLSSLECAKRKRLPFENTLSQTELCIFKAKQFAVRIFRE